MSVVRLHEPISVAACAAMAAWRAVLQANPDAPKTAPIKRADPGAA